MEIRYKFLADAAHYRTVINRFYRQRPLFLRLWVQYGIFSLIVAACMLFNRRPLSTEAVVISAAGASLVTVSLTALTKLLILFRFRRRADFGTEVMLTAAPEGITARGSGKQKRWAWSAYPRSVRYTDGILLLRSGVIRWLPDMAIESGTADDATALVSAKTTLRRVS